MHPFARLVGSRLLAVATAVLVVGCGGDGGDSGGAAVTVPVAPPPIAQSSDITVTGTQQGVTPFIHFMRLQGSALAHVSAIRYTIVPKVGAASKPVHVTYSSGHLVQHGYMAAESGSATIPIFGLYANYENTVQVEVAFADSSLQRLNFIVPTAAYVGHAELYNSPTVRTRRSPGQSLGFDYFYIRSRAGTPVVIDTDGELRWAGSGVENSFSSVFNGERFIIGDANSNKMWALGLDGTLLETRSLVENLLYFHHKIDIGKYGYFAELDKKRGSNYYVESTVSEISESGYVIKEWDMSAILSDYMRSRGDDPSQFVRDGTDWFHLNASAYDALDDSVIVSSRENFVIKIDYKTGRPIWILGDPSKYWYRYPSLRAIALTIEGNGLYPIGQHDVSVRSDGRLMLFNNGFHSLNQPAGAPAGESRSYSAVSVYRVDVSTMSAREEWSFEHEKEILSDICSSAQEALDGSLLINYAAAEMRAKARLVGLDAAGVVAFDVEYASPTPCHTSWNASPIAFENLAF